MSLAKIQLANLGAEEVTFGDVGMEPDMELLEITGNVKSIEVLDEYEDMMDIEVEDAHCYYANGMLTHNSGQELRACANYSDEQTWVQAFLGDGDVHKATAIQLFGEQNYNKDARKKAKSINFGIVYGMSPYSLKDKFNMESIEEAQEFYNRYKAALPQLFGWIDKHCRQVRKEGTAYSYFGFPRRVRYWFQSSDPKLRAFGYRTATNTVVQGAGADILKLAVLRVWKSVLNNPEYKDDCWFICTVHDEINFAVRRSRAKEIILKLVDLMTLKIPGWIVPFEVGLEIGTKWGDCIPFKIEKQADGSREIVPDSFHVEHKEEKELEPEESFGDILSEEETDEDSLF